MSLVEELRELNKNEEGNELITEVIDELTSIKFKIEDIESVDLSEVVAALDVLINKEVEKIDLSELNNISSILKTILESKKDYTDILKSINNNLGKKDSKETEDLLKEIISVSKEQTYKEDFDDLIKSTNAVRESIDNSSLKDLVRKGRLKVEVDKVGGGGGGGYSEVVLLDGDNNKVGVQTPSSVDGDSVYSKDIKVSISDGGTFSSDAEDLLKLFNNLDDGLVDTSATNPKYFEVKLERPITAAGVGIVAHTGNFSNVKAIFKDRQGTVLATRDDSANNTKKTAGKYSLIATNVCCILIEFHTTDTVNCSFLRISKDTTVAARIKGVNPSGVEKEVSVTEDGYLTINDSSSGLAIAKGEVTGHTVVHKFGEAPDFDKGDGEVTVWDGANDAGINQMVYQYSTTADIDSLVSSNNGDTQDIQVVGLDTNYNEVTQTITLTGQTRKALDTNLIRVYRMINVGSTDLVGDVSCYVDSAITLGVVDDSTKVRALINNGNNQTLMALYTVPNGKTAYIRSWFGAIAGANKTSNYIMKAIARPFGQVFQLKHKSAIADTGTSSPQHEFIDPIAFPAKADLEMRIEATAVGVTEASIAAGFDLVLVDD